MEATGEGGWVVAVQQWELEPGRGHPAPQLRLVAAPPRGGRVIPALLFVVLLVGGLSYPAIDAAMKPSPDGISWAPRGLPLSALASLDPVRPMGPGRRPTSSEPLGGILFVSCTNLWTALPDGSRPRKLLHLPGASSPTLSPDARTIAFVHPGQSSTSLYMVAADGAGLTEVGDLSSEGAPVEARVTNLSWSTNSDKMIFSLVDPAYDPWVDGSSVWVLDVSTGEFKRVGSGSPAPSFVGGRPTFASATEGSKPDAGTSFVGAKRVSTPGDDISVGVVPDRFSDSWTTKHGVVVLHELPSGQLELAVKANVWTRRINRSVAAPSAYSFMRTGHISVSQDARRAIVDLRDPKGDRSMGVLDLETGRWTVRDYAWSGTATPAPTSNGPLSAQRAQRLAGDVFGSLGSSRKYSSAALMIGKRDEDLLDGGRQGYVLGTAERTTGGWIVPATLYARSQGTYRFQRAELDMSTDEGRIQATARAISPTYPLRTIEDARRFLVDVAAQEIDLVWPSYLPPGTELDKRWPVDAYSYDGQSVATIHMDVPTEDGSGSATSLSISYGDVNFSLGCGGEMDPEATEIAGQAGLFDHMGNGPRAMRQLLWPATLDVRDSGTYAVFGEMPRAELERIAESMAG